MARKSFSTKERARLFALNKGMCHICEGKIDASLEAWEIEHENPLAMTGDNSDGNLKLAHKKCHAVKTKQDVALIAEAKRREAKFVGAKQPRGSLKGPGFQKSGKSPRIDKKALPPLPLSRLMQSGIARIRP